MGLCASVSFVVDPTKPGHDAIAEEVFMKLGLSTMEVNKLYKAFRDIDTDGTNYVEPSRLCTRYKLEEDAGFIERMMMQYDVGRKGKVDFVEFLYGIWNFLTMDANLLASYAFTFFNMNGSSCLANVKELIESIHHKTYERDRGVRHLVEAVRDINPNISLLQFAVFAKKTPELTEPLLALQRNMRKRIVGGLFWALLAGRRQGNVDQNSLAYIPELISFMDRKHDYIRKLREAATVEKERACKARETRALQRSDSSKMGGRLNLVTPRRDRSIKGNQHRAVEDKASLPLSAIGNDGCNDAEMGGQEEPPEKPPRISDSSSCSNIDDIGVIATSSVDSNSVSLRRAPSDGSMVCSMDKTTRIYRNSFSARSMSNSQDGSTNGSDPGGISRKHRSHEIMDEKNDMDDVQGMNEPGSMQGTSVVRLDPLPRAKSNSSIAGVQKKKYRKTRSFTDKSRRKSSKVSPI